MAELCLGVNCKAHFGLDTDVRPVCCALRPLALKAFCKAISDKRYFEVP